MLRFASASDAPSIREIYDHYALTTAITFADRAPDLDHWIWQIQDARYPFLVEEEEGKIRGFFYAAPFREKDAYRWDVELTVYLRPECRGQGLGTLLLTRGMDILKRQGYLNAYSCITEGNEASVRLHARQGFQTLGNFPNSGYKRGKWHGVTWMWKALGPFEGTPEKPKALTDGERGRCLENRRLVFKNK